MFGPEFEREYRRAMGCLGVCILAVGLIAGVCISALISWLVR